MKMLKTKHFRRLAVFLAMIAPAVYLFGSLFSALTGAHGTEVFAEPVYTQQYVEVDGSVDSRFRFTFDRDSISDFCSSVPAFNYAGSYSYGGNEYSICRFILYQDNYYFQFSSSVTLFVYYPSSGNILMTNPTFEVLQSDFLSLSRFLYSYGTLEAVLNVPTSEVPENSGAYSDYIFKNFFAKDNFLVDWGRNAISENPYGFAPFGAFWRFLDVNILHLSNDQMGLMGYGYMYYCCHVLLFDVGFILVTFFLDFIQKVAEKFTGGID